MPRGDSQKISKLVNDAFKKPPRQEPMAARLIRLHPKLFGDIKHASITQSSNKRRLYVLIADKQNYLDEQIKKAKEAEKKAKEEQEKAKEEQRKAKEEQEKAKEEQRKTLVPPPSNRYLGGAFIPGGVA